MKISYECERCGAKAEQESGAVNRARRKGAPLYCNRTCAGLARRCNKTTATRRAEKAAYDREYREKNSAMLKAKKAAHFKATYDPATAAIQRKKTMPRHVAYCRRPEYREYKQEYDRQHRAKKEYGDYAEAYMATMAIIREVNDRMPRSDLYRNRGTQNKTQNRRRDYERLVRDHA